MVLYYFLLLNVMKLDLLEIIEKKKGKVITFILKDENLITARILNIDVLNKNVIVSNDIKKSDIDTIENELNNHITNQIEIPFDWIKDIE